MGRGRWVFVPDQNEKGSSGSPFFMWLILIVVGISVLYGIVRPDYEYYPVDGSCDDDRNGILGDKVISEDYFCKQECLVYEKWLFLMTYREK